MISMIQVQEDEFDECAFSADASIVRSVVSGFKWFGECCESLLFPSKVTLREQQEAAEILEAYDNVAFDEAHDGLDDVVVEEGGKSVVKKRKPRSCDGTWWVAYALAAREKFPDPSETTAQRRVIHKWISEQMAEARVTMKDRAYALPRAVEWTFVPTGGEVAAAKDRQSICVRNRLDELRKPWWSWWWGARRPAPGTA
jgi:hypothetical protein